MRQVTFAFGLALLLLIGASGANAENVLEPAPRLSMSFMKAEARKVGAKIVKTPFPGSHLYVPDDGTLAHPAVIVLHGSDGGSTHLIDHNVGLDLAAHGFSALCLAYYDTKGTPDQIEMIPVERVSEAAAWLRASGRAFEKVGLYGGSFGALYALANVSYDRKGRFAAVVAAAPHATMTNGFLPPYYGTAKSAFSFRGREIPPGSPLPIWKYPGPIMLIHGTKDGLWNYRESKTLYRSARDYGKKNIRLLSIKNGLHGDAIGAPQAHEAFLALFSQHLANGHLGKPDGPAKLIHSYSFVDSTLPSIGTSKATLMNGAVVSGGALVLDGIDDYLQFDSYLIPAFGSYSVAFEFNSARDPDNYVALLSQGVDGPGFYIGYEPGGQMLVSDVWRSTGLQVPAPGGWHHLAFVVDRSTSRLYLDGALKSTLRAQIGTTRVGTHTKLGKQFGNYGEFFNGRIRELKVFTGALSADEVRQLAITP